QNEQQRERDVYDARYQAGDDDDVTEHLDQRSDHLAQSIERDRDQSDTPVARVEEHAAVLPHGGHQAALPAPALASQHPQALGHFGPRHGIGNERDLVADLVAPQVAVQSHHEVQILDDTGRVVAPHREQMVLAEQAERARDDEVAAQRSEERRVGKEGGIGWGPVQ